MAFFDLPDRQVIYLLQYLRDSLNADQYANQWFAEAPVVESVLARPCFNRVVYKGEAKWILDANKFPVLAIWRETNRVNELNFTDCQAQLCWFARIPAGMADHDPRVVGQTLASNMWHVTKEKLDLLVENPDLASTREKMALGSAVLGDGAIELDDTASVCGFSANFEFNHQKPPYYIDDPDDLAMVTIDLQLYDSATVGGDGIQGDYLGLTMEAEIEPSD